MASLDSLTTSLAMALLAVGCSSSDGSPGGSGTGGTLPATGGAGTGGVYPTRTCVLAGTCGTCVGSDECWEGFQEDGCPSKSPMYSTKTCPELGFPVNCSGQNLFEPEGTVCRPSSMGSGGSGAGVKKAEGDACATTSQCPSGTQCENYLLNSANAKRCMRKCSSHGDCSGTKSPNFNSPLAACDFCNGGSRQCVPLSVCGYSGAPPAACDDCLSSCRGLPSCCTGCGCICENECGQC